jgi:hypothetical protein
MDDSILRTTKKVLGIHPDDDTFDLDIITFINSALSTIQQLGVGDEDFFVSDESAVWEDVTDNPAQIELIRTIVYLRARMLFDPPPTSYAQIAMEKQITELEWRLNVRREGTEWVDPQGVV